MLTRSKITNVAVLIATWVGLLTALVAIHIDIASQMTMLSHQLDDLARSTGRSRADVALQVIQARRDIIKAIDMSNAELQRRLALLRKTAVEPHWSDASSAKVEVRAPDDLAERTTADSVEEGALAGAAHAAGSEGAAETGAYDSHARSETSSAPGTSKSGARTLYNRAIELFNAGNNAAAARELRQFLERYPLNSLASNAAYWLAETRYAAGNYRAAATAFARNYRRYGRRAAKAPDNLLKLGMAMQALGEPEKACVPFIALAEEFPDAPPHIQQALARERTSAGCRSEISPDALPKPMGVHE